MGATMLDLVRRNVERRYGRETWATLVAGPETVSAILSGADDGRGEATTPAREANDTPSDALACWIGRQAVACVGRDWPDLFRRHEDLRAFLLALDERTAGPALHGDERLTVGVRVFQAVDGGLFVTVDGYGARCALVEGLIAGAADRYARPARLELLKCRKHGDNRCVIRVGLEASEADAGLYLAPLSAEGASGGRARVV